MKKIAKLLGVGKNEEKDEKLEIKRVDEPVKKPSGFPLIEKKNVSNADSAADIINNILYRNKNVKETIDNEFDLRTKDANVVAKAKVLQAWIKIFKLAQTDEAIKISDDGSHMEILDKAIVYVQSKIDSLQEALQKASDTANNYQNTEATVTSGFTH